MKKTTYLLIIVLLLLLFNNHNACALDNVDSYDIDNKIQGELSDVIDTDVKEVLEEIGISEFNADEIYNISFDKISNYFADTLAEKVSANSKSFFQLLSIIIICAAFATIFDLKNELYNNVCTIVIVLSSVNMISNSVSATVSILETSGKFSLAFAPIYTLLISLAGNTASALTYNTFVVFISEFISSVIAFFTGDLIGAYFCLGISLSVNEMLSLSKFISIINKAVGTVLGLAASVFTGFLSIRSILSVSLDSVSVKGIRFLISSMIPVVGSSISDAYSSLIGSINLIKGSVAIVGIIVVVIINLPVITENVIIYIGFSVLSYIAECFLSGRTAEVLRLFAGGIRILLLLSLFEMFVITITVGIMLSLKGGV